jgi:hypothetical protein
MGVEVKKKLVKNAGDAVTLKWAARHRMVTNNRQ